MKPDEPRPAPNVLADLWIAEFADLYCAGASLRLSPREVDDLDMWELAATLGMHRPTSDTQQAGGKRDIVAERIAYAKGRGPRPEPDRPPPPDPRLASVIPIAGRKTG